MKTRFNTVDIVVAVKELKETLTGLRVVNVYNVDNRTYLIKFASGETKDMLLFESGNRIHTTDFEWPKNMMPSGFAMKMRKHIRNKRLESIGQLGVDRMIDMQFGSNQAAYHIILELYDRGNVVLTDFEYTILNILRRRVDGNEDVKFVVGEKYPLSLARQSWEKLTADRLEEIINDAKSGENLKKLLNPHFGFGTAMLEHCLSRCGMSGNMSKGKDFTCLTDLPQLSVALDLSLSFMEETLSSPTQGYIITKEDHKINLDNSDKEKIVTYIEFHPILYDQMIKATYSQWNSFMASVDEFFSKLEGQKIELKALQQEKSAWKKLENIKKDHEKRIDDLEQMQQTDARKAELIELNQELVSQACSVINSSLATHMEWEEIREYVEDYKAEGNTVAQAIIELKFEKNLVSLLLRDPRQENDRGCKIDINLSLTPYANASKYYKNKKQAATKQQKTVESSSKALKSAEKKTKQVLKDVAVKTSINKMRKTYWFEKFFWFISSENYLVIGGRDQQQNELIVKRYMSPADVYVHADLHGGSSVVVKNVPTTTTTTMTTSHALVPPKTIHEAGMAAICYSAAWDAKVTTLAWWVHANQVSKTAPTGEYLTTGAFMIRGKKNYLPTTAMAMGFTFLFKLDEESLVNHVGERGVKIMEQGAVKEEEVEEMVEVLSEDEEDGDEVTEGAEQDNTRDGEDSKDRDDEEEDDKDDDDEEDDKDDDDKDDDDDVNVVRDVGDGTPQFPDTTLQLRHVGGEEFDIQRTRTTSQLSSGSSGSRARTCSQISSGGQDMQPKVGKRKLTAKERRDLKKNRLKGKTSEKFVAEEGDGEYGCSDTKVEVNLEKGNGDSQDRMREEGRGCDEMTEEQQIEDGVANITAGIDNLRCDDDSGIAATPVQHIYKRGQKSKLRKMKEKYKDQDEEDRQARLALVGAFGPQRERKKDKKKAKILQAAAKNTNPEKKHPNMAKVKLEDSVPKEAIKTAKDSTNDKVQENDDDVDDDEAKELIAKESNLVGLLNSFTGLPVSEDVLMFAVPCVAPYSAITNYKYKVKLTPGSGKRGRASKTALNIFLRDKTVTQQEKDVLKTVKDLDLARNIPGKVKVSAPNLQKAKKK